MIIYRKDSIKDLGQKLKEMRLETGMSAKEFAAANDIVHSTVCRFEKGTINLRFSLLVKLAIVYDMTVGELLEGIEYAQEVDDSWDRWQGQ